MSKFHYILLLSIFVFLSCKTTDKALTLKKEVSTNAEIQSSNDVKFQLLYLEAAKEFMLQNYLQSRELLETCLEIKPQSAASLFYLSKVYLESGNAEQAIIFAKSAIQQNNQNIWYKIHLVKIYNYVGNYEESIVILEDLIKQFPDNENLYFELIDLYINQKRFSESLVLLNNLEKKTAKSNKITDIKIQIYFQIQDYQSLLTELEELIKIEPENIKYRGLLAEVYAQESRILEAKQAYEELLLVAPNDAQSLLSAAYFYFNLHEYKSAYILQQKAFANPSGDIQSKLQLFLKLTSVDDSSIYNQNSVMNLLDILVDTHPNEDQLQEIRLNFLMLSQDNLQIKEQLLKMISKNKSNFELWKELLLIDSELNDYNSIIEHATEALIYFPNQPIVYYFLGFAQSKNKNYKESVVQLEIALDYLFDNSSFEQDILLLLAESYYKSGEIEKSFKCFDKLLIIDPSNSLALNNYSFYLSLEKQNLTRAVEMARLANELVINNANYLDTYAWALFQSKNYIESLRIIELAMQNGGNLSPTITEHYGDILSVLKQKDKSLKQWKLSQTLGNNSNVLKQKILLEKYIEQ